MAQATPRYKLVLLFVYAIAHMVFYFYPNRVPSFPPVQLSLLPIDKAIPFLPASFVIYISDYFFALVPVMSLRDLDSFNSFARMAAATLVVCGMFFIFLPTAYPRPAYVEANNSVVGFAAWLVRYVDTPNNCFPSLHVAVTAVAAWSLRRFGPRVMGLVGMWAVLILVSTLTTKQHYFVDVLGGLVVAAAAASADYRFFGRHKWGRR